MANIIVWNIRGLNCPNKQEDAKCFIQSQRVGLIALVETKVKKENVNEVANNVFGGGTGVLV